MHQLGVDAFYDFFHRIFHLSAFFVFPRGSAVAAPLGFTPGSATLNFSIGLRKPGVSKRSIVEVKVLVIGGGVIGSWVACRLARNVGAVTVFERGKVGQEATWAAAG